MDGLLGEGLQIGGADSNWLLGALRSKINSPEDLKRLPQPLRVLLENDPEFKKKFGMSKLMDTAYGLLSGEGPANLLRLSTSQQMGAAMKSVSAAAGAAGLAGSGLAGAALGNIQTKLLGNLAQAIAQNELARYGLASNILLGKQTADVKQQQVQNQQDQGILGFIASIAKTLASLGG